MNLDQSFLSQDPVKFHEYPGSALDQMDLLKNAKPVLVIEIKRWMSFSTLLLTISNSSTNLARFMEFASLDEDLVLLF